MTTARSAPTQSLVLGGGCFWCTEAAYELVPGVKAVVSGYAGGSGSNPSYEAVTTGKTGHAEVIRIDYDPSETSLDTLLDFFWEVHDPTTLNRQGADVGTQYRSVIFYANEAQKTAAEVSLARANSAWGGKIVTEIKPLTEFYPAEAYHQDYYRKNPNAGYCRVVIKPKIQKLKKSGTVRGGT
ncbi:MAG TPA: peptide-methionine (S)-S-oxide reductase MsrA [Candidatus Synoicihabitans sp.]|nr:peptide-methionine (S)-S-oxide reductase MsrA [Candidatus Synoicihabitans sp.]